jgi:hypothetical protein
MTRPSWPLWENGRWRADKSCAKVAGEDETKMRYKNIFIVLILFCGTAAAQNPDMSGLDPTELLHSAVAKNVPVRDVAIQATAEATKPNSADEKAKPVSAEPAVSVGPNSQPVSPVASRLVGSQANSLARQLWQDRISSIPQQDFSADRDRLERLLMQLRSVGISRPQTGEYSAESLTVIIDKTPQRAEPNQPAAQAHPSTAAASKISDANTSDLVLLLIQQVCKNPSAVEDSFELAELLYIKGYLKEAAVFYQETLNRQKFVPGQKAWVLYQIGNCLRQTDPASALTAYKQLIAEFSDCPWAEPAKAQEKMLDWLQKEKPRELLK